MEMRHALLLFVLAFVGCRGGMNTPLVDDLLKGAQETLAPDRRTQVFDVKGSLAGYDLTLSGDIHSEELHSQLLRYLAGHSSYNVIDNITVLPDSSLGGRTYGVVSVSVANLRTKPGHASELGTQAILGTPVRLLRRDRGWLLVQTPDQYLGWTDDMIEEMDSTAYDRWSVARKVIVTSPFGWTYASRDRNGQVVSDVVAGALLQLVATDATSYQVQYPDGRIAYLARDLAVPLSEWLSQAHDTKESITAGAHRFFGVPYLWGGTSAKGMDCSGFTKTVFFLNGVLLPRDANQQAAVGKRIEITPDYDRLEEGDLVFFGSRAHGNRPERITHVGIYLGGNKFIHESGDVRINSFNPADSDYSEFRTNTLLAATRIIGETEETGVRRLTGIPYYRGRDR